MGTASSLNKGKSQRKGKGRDEDGSENASSVNDGIRMFDDGMQVYDEDEGPGIAFDDEDGDAADAKMENVVHPIKEPFPRSPPVQKPETVVTRARRNASNAFPELKSQSDDEDEVWVEPVFVKEAAAAENMGAERTEEEKTSDLYFDIEKKEWKRHSQMKRAFDDDAESKTTATTDDKSMNLRAPVAYVLLEPTEDVIKKGNERSRTQRRGVADLSYQNLPLIPMNIYNSKTSGTERLTELRVNNNELSFIPEVIGQLTSLTTLQLNHNLISSLPKSLSKLTRIRALLLHSNQFTELPSLVGNLTNITLLTLSDNKLTELPASIGALDKLVDLPLDNMDISSPPSEICVQGTSKIYKFLRRVYDAESTCDLDLSRFGIINIPSDFHRLENLTELNLSQNRLNSLPQLPFYRLYKLNLNDNFFEVVPFTIYHDMLVLSVFSICRNPLRSIPLDVAQIKGLQALHISVAHTLLDPPKNVINSNNSLQYLRHIVSGIELQSLELSNFNLEEIPAPLDRMWEETPGIERVRQLRLNNNKLTDIYHGLMRWTSLMALELENNELENLPTLIGRLKFLTHFNVSRNKIESIPWQLGQLTSLKNLFIDNNRLTKFSDAFLELLNLENLNISENLISEIPPTISSLVSLTRLDVAGDHLAKYFDISSLKNLIFLNLKDCQLNENPSTIDSMKNLDKIEDLFLSSNKLTFLSPVISNWGLLRNLDISNNFLTILPEEIQYLSSLVKLDVSSNRLTVIPLVFGLLQSMRVFKFDPDAPWVSPPSAIMRLGGSEALEYLWAMAECLNTGFLSLREKDLYFFPPDLVYVTSLTKLSIANNHVVEIPPTISLLTNLTDFSIAGNPIKVLPYELAVLTKLENLRLGKYICENPTVEVLELGTRTILNYLGLLKLSETTYSLTAKFFDLISIPSEILSLRHLVELNLSQNKIRKIPERVGGLENLKILNVSRNVVRDLPWSITSLVSVLTELDISHNLFQKIPLPVGYLTNLQRLGLDGNELIFDPVEILEKSLPERQRYLRILHRFEDTKKGEMTHFSLSSLPERVNFMPENIAVYSLAHNDFFQIERSIGLLTALTRLDLSHNNLTSLPFEMSLLKLLKSVCLDFNHISKIQLFILQLESLQILSIADNAIGMDHLELDIQPTDIRAPLTALILDRNNMGILTDVIPHLTTMTLLSVQENRVSSLPPNLGQLVNLTEINFRKNKLTRLPDSFEFLTNLTHIDFSKNKILALPPAVVNIVKLRSLYLAHNELQTIPWDLAHLTNLTNFDCRYNPLPMFPYQLLKAGSESIQDFLKYNYTAELLEVEKAIPRRPEHPPTHIWPSKLGRGEDSRETHSKLDTGDRPRSR